MGREYFYKPGSFYRICDRTGFAQRSDRTQMEWNGLIVDKRVWEIRQPQDYVKGVSDNQTIPYARPRTFNQPSGLNTNCYFQVYGDLPLGRAFEVQMGKINIFHAVTPVTQSGYPRSF